MFDLYVTRPLAARVVHVLIPTSVSANQVTAISAILGILAGLFIAKGGAAACGWAAVCLLCYMVLDCVDGQLARARGGGSQLGRMLDGASDYAVGIALHLGMLVNLAEGGVLFQNHVVDGWGLFAFMLLAGASMVVHCGLFDYRKQWFYQHLQASEDDGDPLEAFKEEVQGLNNAVLNAFLKVYLFYHRFQQSNQPHGSGSNDKLLQSPAAIREFQTRTGGFLRAASFMGPTTHNVLILLALVAAPFFPHAFWWYVLTVIVPMNVLFVLVLMWGRRLDESAVTST